MVDILRGDGHQVGTMLAADAGEIAGRQRPGAAGAGAAGAQRPDPRRLDAGRGHRSSTPPPPGSTSRSRSARTPRSARRPSSRAPPSSARAPRSGRAACSRTPSWARTPSCCTPSAGRPRSARGPPSGPFAYLRPGTRSAEDAHIGTYVELKKASVGAGAKVPHLTYVGDATIGAGRQHRAGHDLRQLRRRGQEPHHGRRARVRRQQHGAGGAGHRRGRRLHGGGLGDHRRGAAGRPRRSPGDGSTTPTAGSAATDRGRGRRRQRNGSVRKIDLKISIFSYQRGVRESSSR